MKLLLQMIIIISLSPSIEGGAVSSFAQRVCVQSKDPFLEKTITPAENTDWEILNRGVLQMAINAGGCRVPKMQPHDFGVGWGRD